MKAPKKPEKRKIAFYLRIHFLFYIQTIVISGRPYQPQFYWFEFGRLFRVGFFPSTTSIIIFLVNKCRLFFFWGIWQLNRIISHLIDIFFFPDWKSSVHAFTVLTRPFALPILRKQQLRMNVTNEQIFSNEKNRNRTIKKCPHRSSLVRQLAFKSCMHVRTTLSVFFRSI